MPSFLELLGRGTHSGTWPETCDIQCNTSQAWSPHDISSGLWTLQFDFRKSTFCNGIVKLGGANKKQLVPTVWANLTNACGDPPKSGLVRCCSHDITAPLSYLYFALRFLVADDMDCSLCKSSGHGPFEEAAAGQCDWPPVYKVGTVQNITHTIKIFDLITKILGLPLQHYVYHQQLERESLNYLS